MKNLEEIEINDFDKILNIFKIIKKKHPNLSDELIIKLMTLVKLKDISEISAYV